MADIRYGSAPTVPRTLPIECVVTKFTKLVRRTPVRVRVCDNGAYNHTHSEIGGVQWWGGAQLSLFPYPATISCTGCFSNAAVVPFAAPASAGALTFSRDSMLPWIFSSNAFWRAFAAVPWWERKEEPSARTVFHKRLMVTKQVVASWWFVCVRSFDKVFVWCVLLARNPSLAPTQHQSNTMLM